MPQEGSVLLLGQTQWQEVGPLLLPSTAHPPAFLVGSGSGALGSQGGQREVTMGEGSAVEEVAGVVLFGGCRGCENEGMQRFSR